MSFSSAARSRSLVDGPWGWFPLLTVVAGMSALLLAVAYNQARLQLPGAELMYWIAFPIGAVPVFFVLLLPDRPRRERIALVVLLGIEMFWPDRLRSPTSFTGYDELQHLRSLVDILRIGHLFTPNPLLTVSAYFPGLEIVTSAVAQLSGADPFASGVVVVGFVRILFATGLFLLFEEVSSSSRVAGIAAAIYIVNPSFAFFDGAFAYESLALPMLPMILLLTARWARSSSAAWRSRLVPVMAVLLATLIISHHVSSYALAALLITWGVVRALGPGHDRYGSSIGMVALLAVLGVSIWLFTVASLTLGYLFPPLNAAIQQTIRLITTGEGRVLFQSSTGSVAPLWERLAGLGASGILLAALPVGAWAIWSRLRNNSLALLLLVVGLGYPVSLLMRLTPTGSEAAGRSAAVIYLGLALVVALGIVSFGDFMRWLAQRAHLLNRTAGGTAHAASLTASARILLAAGFGVLVIGSAVVGTTPATRLPGAYLVEADARSVDAESLAAATWARTGLGQDRRVAADRVNRLLLGAYGLEHVVYQHSSGVETWQLFLSPIIGHDEQARLQLLDLEYLMIDRRLSRSLPLFSIYYEEGEIAKEPHTTPVSAAVIGKWDAEPAVDRIYDSGDLQFYDVRRLSHAP